MTDPSDIYQRLSDKYSLPIEQVRASIVYFWRSGVKRSLENMVSDEIYINKLGSFKIKDWKLRYAIPMSTALSKRSNMHERNIEYFTKLSIQLVELNKIIEARKLKNKEFREANKQNSGDFQQQAPDMGRPEE